MELPGKKIQDQLARIKKSVEKAHSYFEHNYRRFNANKKFLFVSTLSIADETVLDDIKQPHIECNLLEAFVSRLRGEFSKQEPSMEVSPADNSNVDDKLIEVVEAHARSMEYEARQNGVAYDIYTDLLSGGWSVLKLWTEYQNENSFEQCIKFGKAYDPTLCGFDPLARESHKGDGRFCFELYPKTEDDFKAEYPDLDLKDINFTRKIDGFNWHYSNNKENILLICDFYEKKKKKYKLVKIAPTPAIVNAKIPLEMDNDKYKELIEKWPDLGILEPPPAIIDSRSSEKETICRYRFIENKVLEYVETDFKGFPLIFVGGNSVIVQDNTDGNVKEYTRSYIHNAVGTQKLANVAIQSAGNELENMIQHKFIVAKESIPPEYLSAYTDYQTPSVMLYNAFLDKEGVEPGTVALPPPQTVTRQPMPPEILNVLQLSFQLFQNILGSFDSSLGINNNQLSGVAIVEGATQSNSAAMPFVIGYMQGLNRMIELWIDLFPKYYLTPRTIPIVLKNGKKDKVTINQPGGINFKYGENDLKIKVEAGPNYAVQKSKTLQLLMGLAQSMPKFAEFVNSSDVLPTIVKLLDLPGAEQIQGQVERFVLEQQRAQQAAQNQPNPMMLKLQNEAQNIARETKKDQVEAQIEAIRLQLQRMELENEKLSLALKARESQGNMAIALDKHQSEKMRTVADMMLAGADQHHAHIMDHSRHGVERAELHHKVAQTVLNHERHEAKESPREEAKEHE